VPHENRLPGNAPRILIVDDRATTSIEYALIVSGIAVAIAMIVTSFGPEMTSLFSALHDQLASINSD